MRAFVLFIITVMASAVSAQPVLTFEESLQRAQENYPILKQKDLIEEIYLLKEKNIQSSWLPSLDLGAKASYQSDVVEIGGDLPFPSDFPTPSKDQYNAYVDISQTIYDGGISKKRNEVEYLQSLSKKKGVEVELHKIKEQVSTLFFSILLLQENLDIMKISHEEIKKRIEVVTAAVDHGATLKSELQALQAEEIKIRQNIAGINADMRSSREALNEFIGEPTGYRPTLIEPHLSASDSLSNQRPEKELFELNRSVMSSNQDLLKAQRRPKLMGFGQAGYGKPGLNMISEEFDSYYLIGARFSWTIFDWNKNQRERQILQLNKDVVQTSEDAFDKNIIIARQQQLEKIEKMNQLLKMDKEIVALHEDIVETAGSQLDNGVITSVDYLAKLNEANRAKSKLALHQIQRMQAKANYNILLGH